MKKLNSVQLVSLLILSRLYISMTYTPVGSENSLITIVGGVFTSIIELILIIPALMLAKRCTDKSVVTASFSASRGFGKFVAAAYGIYFLATAVKVLGDFSHFISFAFPVFSFESAIILSMAIAGGYMASLGLAPLARTAVISLFLFAVMLITVILGTSGSIDITNLTLHSDKPLLSVLRSAYMGLGRDSALVLGIFLLSAVDSKRGTMISFISIKHLLVSGIIFLYTSILGSFAQVSQLPFFHLSSYSDTAIVARFDPLFLIVWTITGVCHFAFFIWAGARTAGFILPKSHHSKLCHILSLVAFSSAGIMLFFDKWQLAEKYFSTSIAVIILSAIIPLAVLLVNRRGKNEKA